MDHEYDKVEVPADGTPVEVVDEDADELDIPENPVVPIIHGDGIGRDVGPAAQRVLGAAAEATGREIAWMRVFAGESGREKYDENLPDDTVNAIDEFRVAIKGPLTTPVGAGYRSLNVALRQTLDFYANVRPTYYLDGVPSPVKAPEEMDMVTFRENTEDVYAGIEWEEGTEEVQQVREFVEDEMGFDDMIHEGPVGIGVKPITEKGSKRLVRKAIDYALEHDREKVTLVHKGNIMKFTEGQFSEWGMEVANEEYPDDEVFAAPDSLWETQDEIDIPEGAVMVEERLADAMLQWMQLRTDEFGVLAMPNLNGDYLSDAAAAQVGGLGFAPGANFGDARVLAEPVHGSAPKRAGQNMANPTAMILSGHLMFDYMGWKDAAELVRDAVETTISAKKVTYDFARNIDDAEKLGTTEYTEAVIDNVEDLA
ncbi:MAG: NADP-dependent isocitrate dehydrogenase [Haloarculaceae archaeon]